LFAFALICKFWNVRTKHVRSNECQNENWPT
jgi:hypothetical protein